MPKSIIGVQKAIIQVGGQQTVYDKENVQIQGDVLYTQKGRYQIQYQEPQVYGSMKYIVKSLVEPQQTFSGGNTVDERDVGKMGDIGMFLTMDKDVDKQILKFTSKEFKRKYGLQDVDIDKIQLKYKFSSDQEKQYTKDIAKELDYRYKMYDSVEKYGLEGGQFDGGKILNSISRRKQEKSKAYFNVDYKEFMKYRDAVIGSRLYVNQNGGSLGQQLFGEDYEGGCDCMLENQHNQLDYEVQQQYDINNAIQGGRNEDYFDLGKFLDQSVQSSRKGGNSGISVNVINQLQDTYYTLGGKVKQKRIENDPVYEGGDEGGDEDQYNEDQYNEDQYNEDYQYQQSVHGGDQEQSDEQSTSDFGFDIQ